MYHVCTCVCIYIQTHTLTNINTYINIYTLQKSSTGASSKCHVLEILFRIISEVATVSSFLDIFRKIIINYLYIVCKCSAYTFFFYQQTRINIPVFSVFFLLK